jgi:transcriptional regulator GlxA family with amidase domain
MKRFVRVAAPLVFLVVLASSVVSGLLSARTERPWVCPPCGLPCDEASWDQPGTCPKCGMALVDRDRLPAPEARTKVAVLVFDGVEIIDFAGPWEVFGAAGFDVYAVAASTAPVTTAMGMKVVPRYAFADAPVPDVLLVPGGGVKGARDDAATRAFLVATSARAGRTLSVCNGAFLLANAGLLEGLSATTTAHLVGTLRAEFPKTKVVEGPRFVDNGKIVTAAGLSAGIDGALHLVSQLLGRKNAEAVARRIEYTWRPDAGLVLAPPTAAQARH